ncbi:hypothetical protein [Streptomyces zagrosensis]|uniref:Uncharacterized protein n=1 Tax=Streptomyces zagrosensis TaxID=1042984 RepID=A0A7W9QDU6_9ACTN|nr:hypothetical protein [Streptomyces zagrosensis]MBB5938405.1 hypothetical protein [Streptomyces zagrosensis]
MTVELRSAHPDLSISAVVGVFGSPATVLDLTAEQPDMLVLGS